MRRTCFLSLGAFLIATTDVHASLQAQSPEGFSTEKLAEIRAMLESEVNAGNIGSAVGLISRNDKIVFLEAVGEAGPGVPMFTDAIMRLSSVGKIFTAAAVMVLCEKGVITLDDAVSRYIPAFGEAKVGIEDQSGNIVDLVELERAITIRHLMTHTSGLRIGGRDFEAAWEATESKTTTHDLAERMARIPLIAQPGVRYQYGSYGSSYEVLAALIEVASGRTIEDVLIEEVFEPLAMKDTYFWVPADKLDRLPAIYRRRGDALTIDRGQGEETDRTTFIAGGGGVRSTVIDVWRFGRFLLNGGELDGERVLTPETVLLMMTNQVGDRIPRAGGEFGWGFGARVRLRVSELGSVGTFGWVGGTGAQWWVDPEENLVAVLVTPTVPPRYRPVFDKFERGMYSALKEPRKRGIR